MLWSLWSNRVEILAVGPKVRLKVSRNFSLSIRSRIANLAPQGLADLKWVLNNEKETFERTALVVFFMPCTFVHAQVRA